MQLFANKMQMCFFFLYLGSSLVDKTGRRETSSFSFFAEIHSCFCRLSQCLLPSPSYSAVFIDPSHQKGLAETEVQSLVGRGRWGGH